MVWNRLIKGLQGNRRNMKVNDPMCFLNNNYLVVIRWDVVEIKWYLVVPTSINKAFLRTVTNGEN